MTNANANGKGMATVTVGGVVVAVPLAAIVGLFLWFSGVEDKATAATNRVAIVEKVAESNTSRVRATEKDISEIKGDLKYCIKMLEKLTK